MFYVNTRHNFETVFQWLVMCATTSPCIAPARAERTCRKGFKNATKLAQCHRFDQAVVNVLLSNRHDFDVTQYGANLRGVYVRRHEDELTHNWHTLLRRGQSWRGNILLRNVDENALQVNTWTQTKHINIKLGRKRSLNEHRWNLLNWRETVTCLDRRCRRQSLLRSEVGWNLRSLRKPRATRRLRKTRQKRWYRGINDERMCIGAPISNSSEARPNARLTLSYFSFPSSSRNVLRTALRACVRVTLAGRVWVEWGLFLNK